MNFLGKQTKFDDDAGYYFNMLNESTKSVSNKRKLAESNKLKENSDKEYKVQYYQIFKAPEKPTEKGKIVAQVGADENPWEKADKMLGKGNAFVMAVCDDGKKRYVDRDIDSTAMNESKPRFKLGSERHQNVGVNNRYNYTIQQIDIDNENKTFMRGDTKIVSDKVFKNKQEYEDFIDDLKKKGYKEVENKSQPDFSYRSLRNGSRKGVKTEGKESMKVRESVRKIGKPIKRKVNESMSGKWSEYLYDLIDADAIDTKWLSYAFTEWLSESEVEEFMRDNDILMDDEGFDESFRKRPRRF